MRSFNASLLVYVAAFALSFEATPVTAQPAGLCSQAEITLYANTVQEVTLIALRGGTVDAVAVGERLKAQLSPDCMRYLENLPQPPPPPPPAPSWSKRPWLPCECHQGTCAP